MSVYQYAKSTDSEVIQTVLANLSGRREFAKHAEAWAAERGGDPLYSAFAGRYTVVGLTVKPEGRGRWTQHRNAWRPYRNNRAEHDAMTAPTFTNKHVPGLPEIVVGFTNPDWSRPFMTPRPFVQNGTAWVGLNSAPDPAEVENREGYDPQWSESLASEFYAAAEAHDGKAGAS